MRKSSTEIHRAPQQVMRLARLGSMHQCRLSFMRVLTRHMAKSGWQFSRPRFEIDENGIGHAVYTVNGPDRAYSLIAFAHNLPDHMRSDRVIATAWDSTFALFDGVPDDADIQRLSRNVPRQEAGRVSERELTVSRANRSVRLWRHIVDNLAEGKQPDGDALDAVGYLMRTTAVYGSGKLGAADYETIADRPEMSAPFQAEMLTVYLIRGFVRDLVNHTARSKGGSRAVALAPDIARRLGIGNSTGLGLGPFIINHPLLFNNWIAAREQAIARVYAIESASQGEIAVFRHVVSNSEALVRQWHSEHAIQQEKIAGLRRDLGQLAGHLSGDGIGQSFPWAKLLDWCEDNLGQEAIELVASLVLEPYGGLVDDLAATMADRNSDACRIDGGQTVGQLRSMLDARFGWARDIDWRDRKNCARAWYISEEKLEPRLGERFEESIADYEQPLAPARDAARTLVDLDDWLDSEPVATFLLRHPEHRHMVRRAQMAAAAPYAEILDNTIGAGLFPIDLLRVNLAFFGATHFDPRSDRWLRISMYQNAPYPEELDAGNADLWVYGGMVG